MNLPTDRIHHVNWAYGRIVVPPVMGTGIGFFWWEQKASERNDAYGIKGFRRIRSKDFHNCRATGVY